jgi:hypothetical protein
MRSHVHACRVGRAQQDGGLRIGPFVDGHRVALLGERREVDVLERRRRASIREETRVERYVDEGAEALAFAHRPRRDDREWARAELRCPRR